jgi:transposase
MAEIPVIGLDLAKTVFQVHCVSTEGDVVVRRLLRRSQVLAFFERLPRCLIGMEACASAHHWGRELTALGHEVKLMPPAYVKAYVKRGKTDAADAEAVTRPTMRFVPIKSKEQQAALMLHKTRDLLIRQRTMLINALRGHLGEYGIVAARGPAGVRTALASVRERHDALPPSAVAAFEAVAHQLAGLDEAISELERRILAWHQATRPAAASLRSPGSGRSRRPRSRRPCRILASSGPVGNSQRGSASRRERTAAGARNARAGSVAPATATSAA